IARQEAVVQFTRRQALAMRMAGLLLRERSVCRPADVVGVVTWLGAMQAQDLASGLWSFGVRLHRFTLDEVMAVLVRVGAVRTVQSFVLLDEWVPDPYRPDREEALATIALRYFRSHGPTTRQDFAGWTGLTAADARRGIAAAGDQLATVRVDGTDMYLDPALLDGMPPSAARMGKVLVLPGFDEYLLG